MNSNSPGTGMINKASGGAHRIAIYELAKEMGIPYQELIGKAKSIGIEVKNHMSRLLPEEVSRIQKLMEKERTENTVHERLSETVIRRRSKEPVAVKQEASVPPPEPRVFVRKKVVVASPEVQAEPVQVRKQEFHAQEVQKIVRSEEPALKEPPKKESLHDDVESMVEMRTEVSIPEMKRPGKEEDLSEEQSTRSPIASEASSEAVLPERTVPKKVSEEEDRFEEKDEKEEAPKIKIPPVSTQTPGISVPGRKTHEGLGPTGRVIDLSAFRSSTASSYSSDRAKTPTTARGPRQEVIPERIRPGERERSRDVGNEKRAYQKMQSPPPKKPSLSTTITTAAEHKRVVRMGESIVIKDLANQMGLKATEILKEVWKLGNRSVMINSPIDLDTAQLVANEFEWRVESNVFQEASVVETKKDAAEDLKTRAPVITIMGHVDHGKTSLLDAIRNANVASGEAGGITQHIGAYKVKGPAGEVVFLDTPGHEAFTEMRARGAQATDIVVLVVAADDGVMPQTIEALNHAKDAKVPIVVAVNKIDKPDAQPDRIRQQLASYDLTPEEWGGQTIYVDVSARTRAGIDKLLEMLALQSDVLELRANPNKAAKGIVVEARMDAKRGALVTVLVQEGTLRIGDSVVVGEELGKVRAMIDDKGKTLATAGPSTPVELLGLSGVPRAGDVMNAVSDERSAKELVEYRRQRRIDKERSQGGPVSLDKLMDAMKAGLKELKIILKADVQGSVEALSSALSKLSTAQVKVTIIQAGVGGITETDVNLAKAGNAIILGFHVRPTGKAAVLAEQEGVDIKLYNIIYEALEDIEKARTGLLAPIKREKSLGKAQVRQVFHMGKIGTIAGCGVTEGLIRRNAQMRLIRDSVQIFQGRLASLKRFKEDVREVQQGYECGLSIEGYNDIKVDDMIESFEMEEVAATMGS